MPRPKTKLREGSKDVFQYAMLRSPGGEKIGMVAGAAEAPPYLAVIKAAESFLNRHVREIEEITKLFFAKHGANANAFTNLTLLSFFDIIVRPELVLKANSQTPKRLCAFLTVFPDFTLRYLMTLRRAFVKYQRKQPAFQRAVIALRMRQPILDSYGKPARFEDATDLEICTALNISPATYKKAKQYVARMDAS
jgi:hypothetical protein